MELLRRARDAGLEMQSVAYRGFEPSKELAAMVRGPLASIPCVRAVGEKRRGSCSVGAVRGGSLVSGRVSDVTAAAAAQYSAEREQQRALRGERDSAARRIEVRGGGGQNREVGTN